MASVKWGPCCPGEDELTHGPMGYVLVILKSVNSIHMVQIKFMSTSSETASRWIQQNTFDEKSILVHIRFTVFVAVDDPFAFCMVVHFAFNDQIMLSMDSVSKYYPAPLALLLGLWF